MKFYYGALLFCWLIFDYIMQTNISFIGIFILFTCLFIFVLKEKYYDNLFMSLLFLVLSLFFININTYFLLLAAIPAVDFASRKTWFLLVGTLLLSLYFSIYSGNSLYFLLIAAGGLYGYIQGVSDAKEQEYFQYLDQERRLRYQLEQTKNQLLYSRKEVERLTEIRERNRIARQIHDTIGHSIAGVLFQLEAARKVFGKELEKTEELEKTKGKEKSKGIERSKEILNICVNKLGETLELTRETVYNIKDQEMNGLALIEKLIDNYQFCRVEFKYSGNFNNLPSDLMEVVLANLKEALTNTAKHSGADRVIVKIDIGNNMLRFSYRDNGRGCLTVQENMGLTGMRERIKNTGGTIAIDGSDGFLIVCNIPLKEI